MVDEKQISSFGPDWKNLVQKKSSDSPENLTAKMSSIQKSNMSQIVKMSARSNIFGKQASSCKLTLFGTNIIMVHVSFELWGSRSPQLGSNKQHFCQNNLVWACMLLLGSDSLLVNMTASGSDLQYNETGGDTLQRTA